MSKRTVNGYAEESFNHMIQPKLYDVMIVEMGESREL